YVEGFGIRCDAVTPQMMATPFWKGRFVALIIPTGFANPAYSRLLPALRASEERILRFVEGGGRLLVFGAADDRPDAYDWLPFPLTYRHGYAERRIAVRPESPRGVLVDGYDCTCMPCDGCFTAPGCEPVACGEGGEAVLLEEDVGEGLVVVTSVHEYPSGTFLTSFCCSERETFF
ncbi:MAG: hypothetical protein LUQ03_06785, partial [Methanomicrobiales archaeon]|nr:hypothetical protein [Methanomicrobiales archaeon]